MKFDLSIYDTRGDGESYRIKNVPGETLVEAVQALCVKKGWRYLGPHVDGDQVFYVLDVKIFQEWYPGEGPTIEQAAADVIAGMVDELRGLYEISEFDEEEVEDFEDDEDDEG